MSNTFNPYAEALAVIERHPGTSGAAGLAKLVLSLYNNWCGFSFRECVDCLDSANTGLALKLVSHYAAHGETEALREVGQKLATELYQRLWEAGVTIRAARDALEAKWEREAEQAEHDKYMAAEAKLLTDPAKRIPTADALKLLDTAEGRCYAQFYSGSTWREAPLPLATVQQGIAENGTEFTHLCPDFSWALAVKWGGGDTVYYVPTDYDAREAYIEAHNLRPPRNPPRMPNKTE